MRTANKIMLTEALALAQLGLCIFPLAAGRKDRPLIGGYPQHATGGETRVRDWWERWPGANIGVSTSAFGDGALLIVDVDVKDAATPEAARALCTEKLARLAAEYGALPTTREVATPSGGRHVYFKVPAAVKQGVNVFAKAPGVDIRSKGGYVLGPGSRTQAGEYTLHRDAPIADAPQWLIEHCGRAPEISAEAHAPKPVVLLAEPELAWGRNEAVFWLENLCPAATAGGRNDAGFKAAARLKDLGVPRAECAALLLEFWPCEPMLDFAELEHVVKSAFEYGREAPGSGNTLAQFDVVQPDPNAPPPPKYTVPWFNLDHAYLVQGHVILYKTRDAKDREVVAHLPMESFKTKFAPHTMQVGNGKSIKVTDNWINSPDRLTYDSICFDPSGKASKALNSEGKPRFYNLWRGFSVEPKQAQDVSPRARAAVAAWQDHLLGNVCNGDADHARWLTGFFAHMVQRPWEKPLVAAAFRGQKGVGKNALVERVKYLLGDHALVTSNPKALTGQFNAHLENRLLVVLDEAFWSGDKQAEGQLKNLITGEEHVVERKGQEKYTVDNLTRVAIIGNDRWIVPASEDERRFAVFDVGNGRKQDKPFFREMRLGMEASGAEGYALLLRYLLDFDLTDVDVNEAPKTAGLLQQKIASLEPAQQFFKQIAEQHDSFTSRLGIDAPKKGGIVAFNGAAPLLKIAEEWLREEAHAGRMHARDTRRALEAVKAMLPVMRDAKVQPGAFPTAVYVASPRGETRRLVLDLNVMPAAWDKYLSGGSQ